MNAPRCPYAASGCNSPESECIGRCLVMVTPPRFGWRLTCDVEGVTFSVSAGDETLAEHPGRVSFYVHSSAYSRNLQEYFDTPQSLDQLADMLRMAAARMRRYKP